MTARRTVILGILTALALVSACGGNEGPAKVQAESTNAAPAVVQGTSAQQGIQKATLASTSAPTAPTSGNSLTDGEDFLNAVVSSVNPPWTAWFKSAGLAEPSVYIFHIAPFRPYTNSECSLHGVAIQASYSFPDLIFCAEDGINFHTHGAIGVPLTSFSSVLYERGTTLQQNAFVAANIFAHTFGHHVADELELQGKYQKPLAANSELEADCFAGAWSHAAYGKDLGFDLEAALHDIYGNKLSDHELFSPSDWGSYPEMSAAWKIGYTTGSPWSCMKAYDGSTQLGS